jgi:heme-degrading monooxygenase HmoA
LQEVPGFREFHLLNRPGTDACTLFALHTSWESRDAFETWTRSEAFRKAHANAGGNRDIYTGPPQLELFEDAL